MAGQGQLVDVDTGAVRPGRVLLQRTPVATLFLGFGPTAARVRDLAFNDDADPDPVAIRCRTLAEAPLALLKREPAEASEPPPDAEDRSLRRLAVIEALAKAGFNPDQPRVPKGEPDGGEWTGESDEAGTDEPAARLRPGHYIDELADFVEWIANAKPEDEKAIRREISRYYYKVGDVQAGNALNAALSDAIEPGLPLKDRQEILDSIAPYAMADPAEMGAFTTALAGIVLAAQPPAMQAPRNTGSKTTEAAAVARANAVDEAATIAAPAEQPSEVWKLGWAARGVHINDAFGGNLPANFPVVDRFVDGVVTSIKSIDLNAVTYRNAGRLSSKILSHLNALAEFEGRTYAGETVSESAIRVLHLIVPKNTLGMMQREVIAAMRLKARDLKINLVVSQY